MLGSVVFNLSLCHAHANEVIARRYLAINKPSFLSPLETGEEEVDVDYEGESEEEEDGEEELEGEEAEQVCVFFPIIEPNHTYHFVLTLHCILCYRKWRKRRKKMRRTRRSTMWSTSRYACDSLAELCFRGCQEPITAFCGTWLRSFPSCFSCCTLTSSWTCFSLFLLYLLTNRTSRRATTRVRVVIWRTSLSPAPCPAVGPSAPRAA